MNVPRNPDNQGWTKTYEQPSDRGSIKFLLNGGTDSFTEQFRLPPRGDRARGLVYHNKTELEEAATEEVFPFVQNNRQDYTPTLVDSDLSSLQFFQDTFLGFFNGPFGDGQKTAEDPFTGQITYQAAYPGQGPNLSLSPEQAVFEPERPFAMALIQSILARAWTVPLDAKSQEEISTNLNFLLTTARIRKFISLYFKYWQPSCAMIHIPSFDPETVAIPLLASVVFMGAMYSSDQREVYVAKRVLDFAELYIFSSHVYSPESEIAITFSGNQSSDDESSDWAKFQNFQAGFIIIVVQYWAGCPVSRNRAMENRFSEVVKVARRLRLVKCRHTSQDQLEHQWIQTECRIRIISLLDCAFLFYQNYPCRLTHSEMECELPCEESLFQSPHPLSEPDFRFTRGITLYGAFKTLFDPSHVAGQPPDPTQMNLTVMDMFILIHGTQSFFIVLVPSLIRLAVLFSFINTHMTLVGLLNQHAGAISTSQSPVDGIGSKGTIPEDSLLGSIRIALNRWRDHWIALRNKVSSDEWASMGFYKNGYNFWLVSQLLITKKDAVDVIMQLEVHCEDKLERLKVLLLDE
ncbi:uncharacterized protein N7443_006421 [Penicillium atrosanguineum]|uniref:uncharacterized protein n=1 Tax=Penicillium atrosanguineum TaxID=1132637 RepID=UPI0023A71A55|nr:uncharacterized protein N7443_006421 [Penicillium atrosanguineum]KAJ5298301.1 hypothetical protein N7443_006421 [Penicillium atrosanguineum]